MVSTDVPFLKGHGTENDFIVLFDVEAQLDLTPKRVRALCDRRQGIGADGVLRIVPTSALPVALPGAEKQPEWFMDYRNSDGSIAEMCGNGARLYAVALRGAGLIDADHVVIGTRGGVRQVQLGPDGVTVEIGTARSSAQSVEVTTSGGTWQATPVWLPNPHAVAVVGDLNSVGPLTSPPDVTPTGVFPDGVNVEFVSVRGGSHIAMRVHERGVGETRSCGTGAVAAAWAWSHGSHGSDAEAQEQSVRVDVPGGTLVVSERADGVLTLTGPVAIVARGTIDQRWWEEQV